MPMYTQQNQVTSKYQHVCDLTDPCVYINSTELISQAKTASITQVDIGHILASGQHPYNFQQRIFIESRTKANTIKK